MRGARCSLGGDGGPAVRPGLPGRVLAPTAKPAAHLPSASHGLLAPLDPPATQQGGLDGLELQPRAAATLALTGAAGLAALAVDTSSLHLLEPLDAAAHLWVTNSLEPEMRRVVAGKLVSDSAITAGLAGWAAAAGAALLTRHERLARALGVAGAVYFAGGGAIRHGDPLLVDGLKHAFHRARPSDIHATFAFPSGHTTAATFICGTLLFLLLPLALQALQEQQAAAQQAEAQQAEVQRPGALRQAGAWLERHRWGVLVGASAVTATGRVLADAHWCSDTMAGFCLGLSLTACTVLLCGEAAGSRGGAARR